MRRALWSWLLVLGACQPQSIINPVSLLGPVDLVIVDALGAGGELARASGGSRVGLPSGRVFVTSTDSNELRVFEPFRVVKEGTTAADWARAPNPLETLSIPVIEWPTMLAADEGKGTDGRRVTGAYVYASRTGANEVSVVSVRSLKTLGSLPVPGALTAFTAWMNVEAELVPGDTTLFAATWDGDVSRLWQVSLPTDDAALASALAEGLLQFTELSMQPGETIKALQVVPPSPARTFDGAPFCAAGPCLAVATRDGQGGGTTSLVELSTGAAAPLDFGGPMRRFALSHRADGDVRLYGILDEQYCGGPSVCGGVVSVELAAGAGSYVLSTDLQGQPMRPLRAGAGPITGLSIAPAATLRQELELVGDSSTNLTTVNALYLELGAFSSANGTVSFFDATAGLLLDYNALRSEIDQVALRLPGQLEDGAWSYVAADGSPLGTQEQGTLIIAPSREGTHSRPWRDVTAVVGGGEWQLQLFDGYLSTQYIYAAVNGVVAYGERLATADADGAQVHVPSWVPAQAGDVARFYTGPDDALVECGRAAITSLAGEQGELDAVPESCAGRTRFDVLAYGTQPVVLRGSVEGPLGRAAAGEVFSYHRHLEVAPAYVARADEGEYYAPRAAFTVTVPAALPGEGAEVAFSIAGNLAPYRVGIDALNVSGSCTISGQTPSQILFGDLASAFVPRPQSNSDEPRFSWFSFSTIPSGNAMLSLDHSLLQAGSIGAYNGVRCL